MNTTEFHSLRKFADTPNARVAYLERGSGPVTLLLHAFPLCGFQWRDVIDDLAPVRRCIAPDLMGLGYSEVGAGADISFTAQAAMLAGLLDKLASTRSMWLATIRAAESARSSPGLTPDACAP